eukprot:2246952-Ditylum_brightwellii.AAC.1
MFSSLPSVNDPLYPSIRGQSGNVQLHSAACYQFGDTFRGRQLQNLLTTPTTIEPICPVINTRTLLNACLSS